MAASMVLLHMQYLVFLHRTFVHFPLGTVNLGRYEHNNHSQMRAKATRECLSGDAVRLQQESNCKLLH